MSHDALIFRIQISRSLLLISQPSHDFLRWSQDFEKLYLWFFNCGVGNLWTLRIPRLQQLPNEHIKHVFLLLHSVFFLHTQIIFFSKSDHSCQRDWRQKTTFSMGDGKMSMLTLPAFATSVSKWLRLSRDREYPHAAEKQLLYPGSLCGKLKRIVTLPRRLQIKWHRPWLCSSSPIDPPIQDLKWFFSSS